MRKPSTLRARYPGVKVYGAIPCVILGSVFISLVFLTTFSFFAEQPLPRIRSAETQKGDVPEKTRKQAHRKN